MTDFHKYLGEGILAVYFIMIVVGLVMERRGKALPAAATGVAHGLLGLQVALGLILISSIDSEDSFNWFHPVFGFLAFGSLMMMNPLREKVGKTRGMVYSLALAFVFALVAYLLMA